MPLTEMSEREIVVKEVTYAYMALQLAMEHLANVINAQFRTHEMLSHFKDRHPDDDDAIKELEEVFKFAAGAFVKSFPLYTVLDFLADQLQDLLNEFEEDGYPNPIATWHRKQTKLFEWPVFKGGDPVGDPDGPPADN